MSVRRIAGLAFRLSLRCYQWISAQAILPMLPSAAPPHFRVDICADKVDRHALSEKRRKLLFKAPVVPRAKLSHEESGRHFSFSHKSPSFKLQDTLTYYDGLQKPSQFQGSPWPGSGVEPRSSRPPTWPAGILCQAQVSQRSMKPPVVAKFHVGFNSLIRLVPVSVALRIDFLVFQESK